jgi:haloalkane dehalogenase
MESVRSDAVRTPDERFEGLPGFDFAPHYLDWNGLRMHYLDEGPRDAPVFLLMHGEPSWSYLYAGVIPALVAAGYRCIAPDYIGFGRSDKVVADDWYVIERHIEAVRFLIEELDLRDVSLVVQDWGGPIGLRQAVDMPERFRALYILNTWLHHEGYNYNQAIRGWRAAAMNPQLLGGDMPAGRILGLAARRPDADKEALAAAYDAPFPDITYKAGIRRFPWCLPFAQPVEGNAADQQRCFEALKNWGKPAHFIFGDADAVFTMEWAEQWSAMIPGATLDRIEGAGHFVQQDAATDLATAILARAK